MKTHLLTKMLLLATGLLVGVSQLWAEEKVVSTTSVESAYRTSNELTVSTSETTNIYTRNTQFRLSGSSANGTVKYNSNGKIAFYKFSTTDFLTAEGTMLNATLVVSGITSDTSKGSWNIYIIGYNGETSTYNDNSGNSGDLPGTVNGTQSFQPLGDGSTNLSFGKVQTSVNVDVYTYLKSVVEAEKEYVTFAVTVNQDRDLNLDVTATLKATYTTTSVTNYTIVYMDETGEVLKSKVVENIDVDTEVTATEDDMASFVLGSKKYIYKEGNSTIKLVKEAESNVITLTFREAAEYRWTLKSNLGATIKTGTAFEGDDVEVFYPCYQLEDGVLYSCYGGTKQYSVTFENLSENSEKTITYTKALTDIVYYSEAEDIPGISAVHSQSPVYLRASNGTGGVAKDYLELVTLEAGVYNVTVVANGKTNSGAYQIKYGETETTSWTATGANWRSNTWENIAITAPTTFYVKGGYSTTSDQVQVFDLVYIQQVKITATIGTTGYTTFASTAALDVANLPEGLTAYKASAVGETSVTFTSVEDAVVAGTGLLLKGTAGTTYSIPVAAAASEISDNKLVGVTEETALEANENYYVLVNNGGTAEFQSLASNGATIPAGKAYLNAEAAGSRLRIVFNNETTGISTIEEAAVLSEKAYNLNGQRVAAPVKGLYIVNGKKVIMK